MPTRPLLCLLAVLAIAPARAEAQFAVQSPMVPAEVFTVEIGAMLWRPTPDLVITTDAFAPVGGTVDFVNAFGIDEQRFTEWRLVLKGGKHKFRASRVVFDYQEDALIEGIAATANIEWELWRVGYEYDAFRFSHGFIGLVTELKYNEVEASIATPFGDAATLQTAPIPTVGGIGRGYFGEYVSVTGEFTLMKLDGDDYRGKFFDLDIYGTGHFGKSFGVQVGYRSVRTDYLVDDDEEGDLKMEGFYFGGLVRF